MNIAQLQSELPWTDKFSDTFKANPETIKDFRHALDHIDMASGDLRKLIHSFEHANIDGVPTPEPIIATYWSGYASQLSAQLVIFTARLAQTWPGGFDLSAAVAHELAIRKQHAAIGT